MAMAIDDGGAATAALGARGGLQVEGVEIVVAPLVVEGRVAVQARQRASQNGDLANPRNICIKAQWSIFHDISSSCKRCSHSIQTSVSVDAVEMVSGASGMKALIQATGASVAHCRRALEGHVSPFHRSRCLRHGSLARQLLPLA